MIEGLKCRIRGEKLVTIVNEQAEALREKAAKVEAMLKAAGQQQDMASNVGQLEQRVQEHRSRADELSFIAKHLDTNEVYELDTDALRMIGVITRHW